MKCPACENTRIKKLFNGVCFCCRDKFDKRHRAVCLEGKEEAPIAELDELPNHHARHSFEETGHFGDTGELVAVTIPPDFTELDSYLGKQPESVLAQAGDILREIFIFCFSAHTKTPLKTAAARFAAVTSGLRPEILCNSSRTVLAAELGYTKAAMAKMSVTFEKRFGFKFARSRSLEARQHMASAAMGHNPTNTKRRKNGNTPIAVTATAAGPAEAGATKAEAGGGVSIKDTGNSF
jgi:hypothetical protein